MTSTEPTATANWESDQREFIELIDRAQAGDRSVLSELDQLLERRADIWERCGDLGRQAEQAWVTVCAGSNLLTSQTLKRRLAALKDDLRGVAPTQLEQLLVDRIAVCWLQVHAADLEVARTAASSAVAKVPTPRVALTRLDSANHRYLAAMKQLAQVRKLLPVHLIPAPSCATPIDNTNKDQPVD